MYAAVVQAKPELGKKGIVAALMSDLNESLPAVVPHLWHAVLTTVTSVPASVLIYVACFWPCDCNRDCELVFYALITTFLCIPLELVWWCRHWKHTCPWPAPVGIPWWLWSCQADLPLFTPHSRPCLCSSTCVEDLRVLYKIPTSLGVFPLQLSKEAFADAFLNKIVIGWVSGSGNLYCIKFCLMICLQACICICKCFCVIIMYLCYVIVKYQSRACSSGI